MKKFEDTLTKAGEGYSLSHDERAKMSRVLREYMAMKPVPHAQTYSVSVSYRWFTFAHRPIAAALVLVLIFGSGVTYAAEGALPGEALYAVKTYINEPARIVLATDAEAKAEVQIELAERRIEEAAVLAAEGRLDSETEDDLAVAFESHAAAAAGHMEAADKTDESASLELAARFENRLVAHEEVLLEVESGDEDRHSPRLADAIRTATENVINIRAANALAVNVTAPADSPVADMTLSAGDTAATDIATESAAMSMSLAADAPAPAAGEASPMARSAKAVTVAPQAERTSPDAKSISRMKSAAEKSLKNTQKKFRSAKSLSDEARARAEADLLLADSLLMEGTDFLDDDHDAEAYAAFQESLRVSEQAAVYIKAAPTLEKARARWKNSRQNSENRAEPHSVRDVEISVPAMDATITVGADATVTAPSRVETAPRADTEDNDEEKKKEDTDVGVKVKLDLSL